MLVNIVLFIVCFIFIYLFNECGCEFVGRPTVCGGSWSLWGSVLSVEEVALAVGQQIGHNSVKLPPA